MVKAESLIKAHIENPQGSELSRKCPGIGIFFFLEFFVDFLKKIEFLFFFGKCAHVSFLGVDYFYFEVLFLSSFLVLF
jgi:hypothetical protein